MITTVAGNSIEGRELVYGCGILPIKEIRPKQAGRVRLRFRDGDFAQAFVRTASSIGRFYIADMETHWELVGPTEENRTLS